MWNAERVKKIKLRMIWNDRISEEMNERREGWREEGQGERGIHCEERERERALCRRVFWCAFARETEGGAGNVVVTRACETEMEVCLIERER